MKSLIIRVVLETDKIIKSGITKIEINDYLKDEILRIKRISKKVNKKIHSGLHSTVSSIIISVQRMVQYINVRSYKNFNGTVLNGFNIKNLLK